MPLSSEIPYDGLVIVPMTSAGKPVSRLQNRPGRDGVVIRPQRGLTNCRDELLRECRIALEPRLVRNPSGKQIGLAEAIEGLPNDPDVVLILGKKWFHDHGRVDAPGLKRAELEGVRRFDVGRLPRVAAILIDPLLNRNLRDVAHGRHRDDLTGQIFCRANWGTTLQRRASSSPNRSCTSHRVR